MVILDKTVSVDELKSMAEDFFLINIRPWQGNRSRNVEDENIRAAIIQVVREWVK